MTAAQTLWEFWIDRGGTFTDVIARAPDGRLEVTKLLSEAPELYEDAGIEAIRRRLEVAPGAPLPGKRIGAIKLGTTVATNALLERRGANTVFVTTRGFADALTIGDQTRPDIFALAIDRPRPLQTLTIEIDERVSGWGDVLTPLDETGAREALEAAREHGCESVAICLMHAWTFDRHERRLADLAAAVGFEHISISADVDPLMKFVPRARTTLADAYLTPVVRRYVERLERLAPGAPLYFMTSAGGLVAAQAIRGRDALVSGPAGGVIGMAETARRAGFQRVIGFDMGGTSTDVSRFDGEDFERRSETEIAGWKVRAPLLAVHTVAAGGGSILAFDGERARVGPHSAGAQPGPACYGLGGPLTLTDANLILGRIDPRFFPSVFGPDGERALNPVATRKRFAKLAFEMGAASIEAAAEGFLAIGVETMTAAVRRISMAQGVDPERYALQSFGGAGGQIATRVADALGIKTVLVHPFASVLSAFGIGLAERRTWRETAFAGALDGASAQAARERLKALEAEARDDLEAQGVERRAIRTRGQMRLKYAGSDAALTVPAGSAGEMRAAFDASHRRLFGFEEPGRELVFESLAALARAAAPGAAEAAPPACDAPGGPIPSQMTKVHIDGAWCAAPVYRAETFGPNAVAHGPALIVEPNSQIVLEPGWRIHRGAAGLLVLERFLPVARAEGSTAVDPVRLELFNQRFMSLAEEMGAALERTAHSVNIKERLDFSCAVFDAEGGLVANAPHMPVHLGSMGASVKAALAAHPDLAAGEAIALNDPYRGGTHLPDVTVIAPVCDRASGERLFFVAARGHHADVGGVEPGSMPPFSTRIEDEGVLFDAVKILDHGQFQESRVRAILRSGAFPARDPDRSIADLKAQLAACARGADELARLVADHGLEVVREYMGHVQANAEAAVRRVIDRLSDGRAEMRLDDGSIVRVEIRVDRAARSAVVDFSGTSPQQASNFNAPAAVARAAVLYVFRCLVGDRIPLNDGCLIPLTILTPKGSLLDPEPPAAVVAGNVETSQLVVDALFAATGAMAAAQGTMNNLTFGDDTRQYYETICGGAGAGPGHDGVDGVHTHMTNSRLTDPEVLETRFPVLVERFGLRPGSGGAGARPGGDGVIRRILFLDTMSVALLSSRRAYAPPGLAGGGEAATGAQRLIRADGTVRLLEGRFRVTVNPGDAIEIETPGGGGYGAAGAV